MIRQRLRWWAFGREHDEPVPHVHRWAMTAFDDRCHWLSRAFVCRCGATRYDYRERDMREPYSAVFIQKACTRCRELEAGDDPVVRSSVLESRL